MTNIHNAKNPTTTQPLKLTSVSELFDTPEESTPYCVEDLLPSEGLSILAGKPKAGKSCLARQLAVAVAKGEDFLERRTDQGLVLYLALEEKQSEVKKHFKDLGLSKDAPLQLYCAPAPPDALLMLGSNLRSTPEVKLVIIDPIFKFIKVSDSNDYVKVTDALEPLLTLARRYRVHIMTVHHMKKRVTEDPMDGNLGSTAIAAAVDTYIALQRKPTGTRTLCSVQRYGKDLEETQVLFDPLTRKVSLGMTPDEVEAVRVEQTLRRLGDDILNHVAKHPGCTQQEVFGAVQGKATPKKRAFTLLVEEGTLQEHGPGTKGQPYKYTSAALPIETQPAPNAEPLIH